MISYRYYYTILPTVNHTITDAYHLVSTILSIIPVPLTTDIQDYNKSVIKRHLIRNCIEQLNQLLQEIRSSLTELSTLLTGCYDTIDDKQLQLLHCLLASRVPTCWHCPLKLPTTVIVDLTDYLDMLQRMSTAMREYLQPMIDNVINITFIPNINALLQEFKSCYCHANNLQADDVYLLCQVTYYPVSIYQVIHFHYSY